MSIETRQRRLSTAQIRGRKGGDKLVCLTAYTAPVARLLDEEVDLLLVGDSLAMVIYGFDSTLPVTLDMMVAHGGAVVRATHHATIVVDLPFGQQKLVGLARALMNDGPCLLLDEPMAGVEGSNYETMQRIVRDEAAAGRAVCVVEHNVSFIRDLCTEAVFMSFGRILQRGFYSTLVVIPLLMAATAVALIAFGGWMAMVVALLALWGLTGTSAPVGWWAWIAKVFPKDAEAGGGLFVAVVQLSIALGSTVGGLLFDHSGYRSTFIVSAVSLAICAVLTMATARQSAEHA